MVTPEINLVDSDSYERGGPPYEQFAWLRAHAPVFWHTYGGAPDRPGFRAITRHDDIEQVARRPEIFSSARRTSNFYELPYEAVQRRRLGILNADPPQHTRLRGLVNRGFTPRRVLRLEERSPSEYPASPSTVRPPGCGRTSSTASSTCRCVSSAEGFSTW